MRGNVATVDFVGPTGHTLINTQADCFVYNVLGTAVINNNTQYLMCAMGRLVHIGLGSYMSCNIPLSNANSFANSNRYCSKNNNIFIPLASL